MTPGLIRSGKHRGPDRRRMGVGRDQKGDAAGGWGVRRRLWFPVCRGYSHGSSVAMWLAAT